MAPGSQGGRGSDGTPSTPPNLPALRAGDLQKLRRDCDAIVHAISRGSIEGAINWGDLGCTEAARVETDDGHVYLRVEIEEASSASIALIGYVTEKLALAGWPDVQVVTEW